VETEVAEGPKPRRKLITSNRVIILLEILLLISSGFNLLDFNPPAPPLPPRYRMSPGAAPIEFYRAACDKSGVHLPGTRFAQRNTRCVFGNFHPPQFSSYSLKNVEIHVIYYQGNGSIACESTTMVPIDPSDSGYLMEVVTGWDEPGNWSPDTYHVIVFHKDKVIAEGDFEIMANK
jgi:hypothetical protein